MRFRGCFCFFVGCCFRKEFFFGGSRFCFCWVEEFFVWVLGEIGFFSVCFFV